MENKTPTSLRKQDHIRICLEKPVLFDKSNGFEKIELIHNALPELDFNEINIKTNFLGKKFEAPLIISAMTGGSPETERINKNLAMAAEELGIGMGVGSQRAAIEEPALEYTYKVRDVAPDIFLLGNLGAAEILKYNIDKIKKAVEMIDADGLVIHLNIIQELLQPEGNKRWKGVLKKIKYVCSVLNYPVIVKEVGCGISGSLAKKLANIGVAAIDVAGAGGTNWAKIEYYRNTERNKYAKNFFEWGIKTADALRECVDMVKIPIIASGGIRTGTEVAKALAMGSNLVGIALPLLKPATISSKKIKEKLEQIILELKTAMFLTGAKNIEQLNKTKIRVLT